MNGHCKEFLVKSIGEYQNFLTINHSEWLIVKKFWYDQSVFNRVMRFVSQVADNVCVIE